MTSNSTDADFDITFDGDIAVITMGKGENRIDYDFLDKMHTALDKVLLREPPAKAVITTGQGRFYSNGFDIQRLASRSFQETMRFLHKFSLMLARILTFPLPTVAAVNGHAYAAAALLTLAHDHIIMQTERGWWCMNEVHANLRIPTDLLALLRSKLYPGQTLHEAVVLGRRFTAEGALVAGIVHEICAPADLMPRAMAWIRTSLPKSGYDRSHLERMKRDVYRELYDGLRADKPKL